MLRSSISSALLVATVVGSISAQTPSAGATLLITPASLASRIGDPSLVLLHVGNRADYERAHLPGARLVAMSELTAPTDRAAGATPSLTLELPTSDALRQALERLGISDGSRIVVYGAGDALPMVTRVWYTLDHAGFGDRTSVLDGGITAWVRGGHPTTTDAAVIRPGKISPLKIRASTVDADWVRAKTGTAGVALVDARAGDFYDGTREAGPQDARRRGHIAGALSIPYSSMTDDQGALRSPTELAALFARAGVKPGDTVVTYCHIGQQATATLFGARLAGFDVRLYDGSFEDWARRGWPLTIR